MTNQAIAETLSRLEKKVTEANDNKFKFTIAELVNAAHEEIKSLKHLYLNQVLQNKKNQWQTQKRIKTMEAILQNLKDQRDGHMVKTPFTILGHPLYVEYHGLKDDTKIQQIFTAMETFFEENSSWK